MVDPNEYQFVDGTDEFYSPEELAELKAKALAELAGEESAYTDSAGAPAESVDPPNELAATDAPASDTELESDLAPWVTPRPKPAVPRLVAPGSRRGRKLAKPDADRRRQLTPEQRLLILDSWLRSGLPAKDFAALVGLSKHTLYSWKAKFAERGPEGLVDRKRGGPTGSRLHEFTKRAILLLKKAQPDAGCQRISDLLARGPALPASPNAVARVLKEAGYELQEEPTRRHPAPPHRFEKARPNQMWQTDLFTFRLKRQNRAVHLVAFLDDHSRYITCWGLSGSASGAFVLDTLKDGLANYPPPTEILTDNGSQYVTWRGTSKFAKELRKRGIAHIIAKPRRPQTLGKTERFWGTLWREFLDAAVFIDMNDAKRRIGHFVDYYNFRRTHRGIEGNVPADRYFDTADTVRRAIEERVAENALELARHGVPKKPFYLAGQTGDGAPFSVHASGDGLVMIDAHGKRHDIDPHASLPEPEPPAVPELAPGQSDLDEPLRELAAGLGADPPPPPVTAPPAAPDADDDADADEFDLEFDAETEAADAS